MSFITDTRSDGSTFTRLADDAPEELRQAVEAAHAGTLPNDWIYDECKAAFEAALNDNNVHEYADSRVDIYTHSLYRWAADMVGTDLYTNAEEEAEDLQSADSSIEDRIRTVQYRVISHIALCFVK